MQTEEAFQRDFQSRRFGRKGTAAAVVAAPASLADDLRLFALTFAGGFLFVSLYLA